MDLNKTHIINVLRVTLAAVIIYYLSVIYTTVGVGMALAVALAIVGIIIVIKEKTK